MNVVPVPLGCCPPGMRCIACATPPSPPSVETLLALVEAVRRDRGDPVRVGFFGGDLPPEPLLDAIAGLPFTVRVRPDRLDRASVDRLAARGCVAVELDAWTFDDRALTAARRPYTRRILLQQLEGIPERGMRVGVVLVPGLPGTRHADAVEDARTACARVSFARIHPLLVFRGSELAQHVRAGTWSPMSLGEAVTTCREVADVLTAAGVEIVRIGLQPRHDGLGVRVAGPWHPSFRQLVEARGSLSELHARLEGTRPGSRVEIRCHPSDETVTRGPLNQHVRTLRAVHRLAEVSVLADADVARGTFIVSRGT